MNADIITLNEARAGDAEKALAAGSPTAALDWRALIEADLQATPPGAVRDRLAGILGKVDERLAAYSRGKQPPGLGTMGPG